jgi:transcription factor C subunit 6
MPPRRPRRTTTKVDYSQFGDEGDANSKSDQDADFAVKGDASDDDAMDVDVKDVDEDEELPDIDEGDNELDEKKTQRKSAKPRKAAKKPSALSTGSKRSSLVLNLPSAHRKGNLMERVTMVLGSNRNDQFEGLNARQIWANSMFTPITDSFGKYMKVPTNNSANRFEFADSSEQSIEELSENALEKYLLPANRQVTLNESTLESYKDRVTFEDGLLTGAILNVGGMITSVAWAPGLAGYEQYIAVGVLDDNQRDPLKDPIHSPMTSLFSAEGYASSFYIYKVNLDPTLYTEGDNNSSMCQLVASYSHDFGSVSLLKWRPQNEKNDADTLGLLAFLCQDGKLRVLNVKKPQSDTVKRYKISQALKTYEFPGYKITCFCWRTENVLAVGTEHGSVAEYDISDTESDEPSYTVTIATTVIFTISSGYPNNSDLLFEQAADGFCCCIDTRNPNSREYSLRIKTNASSSGYLPWASSFVSVDDLFQVRAQPVRDFRVYGTINSFTGHRVPVTAIGVSTFHPFLLSGGMDGQVKVGNTTRRLIAPQRVLASTYTSAVLWQLDFSQKATAYRISPVYRTEKISKGDAIELLQPYPANVMISDLAWSSNIETAEWYAAGTSSGLLKLHRLYDHKLNAESE